MNDLVRISDQFLSTLAALPPVVWLVGVVVVLAALAWLTRRLARTVRQTRPDRWIDGLATVIGLGWSSQGMWETATRRYGVVPLLAAVLFFVFESMMVAQMLRAYRYRDDRPRRGRYVRAVWVIAALMGCIVALAEGWAQAPLRLAIPLLVAYTWWLGLTSDDDPTEKLASSWRWTPRRIGLELGLLDEGAQDARAINRGRLTRRIRSLTFADRWGSPVVGTFTRRRERLARMLLIADDAIIADVENALARAARIMDDQPIPDQSAPEKHPIDDQPEPPVIVKPVPAKAPPDGRLPQGVHMRAGRVMRGEALERDAIDRMIASVGADRPAGMSNAELALMYEPPLKSRLADRFGAEARREIRERAVTRVNGKVPDLAGR